MEIFHFHIDNHINGQLFLSSPMFPQLSPHISCPLSQSNISRTAVPVLWVAANQKTAVPVQWVAANQKTAVPVHWAAANQKTAVPVQWVAANQKCELWCLGCLDDLTPTRRSDRIYVHFCMTSLNPTEAGNLIIWASISWSSPLEETLPYFSMYRIQISLPTGLHPMDQPQRSNKSMSKVLILKSFHHSAIFSISHFFSQACF